MAERAASKELLIHLVWVNDDWHGGSPLAPHILTGSEPVQPNGFAIEGLDARQPAISSIQLAVGEPCTLDQFLARFLAPAAAGRLDQSEIAVAVFGRRARRDQLLRAKDRIELLGPIVADPKSDRLARVKADRQVSDRDKWRTKPDH